MFERLSDWPKSVALICDIAKGNATISLRTYANRVDAGVHRPDITGWDHHQIQARGRDDSKTPRLFTSEHLARVLSNLSQINDQFYAYEVDGALDYENDAKILLTEIADIVVTTVKLTVGDVRISWFLVGLKPGRDTVHWKMRYEGRDRKPGYDPEAVARV